MRKVLVDRELLAGVCSMVPEKMKAARKEIRAILAQPAEAEGVSALDDLLALYPLKIDKQAFVINGGAPLTADGDDEFLSFKKVDAALGEIRLLAEQGRAALSAVAAERDRLREEAELHDRIMSESCAKALAERDQLRAEAERYVPLHEAVQRAAGELPEGWAIQLYIERDGGGVELIGPDGTEDFATNNERLDYTVIDALEAAMSAKEA